MESILRATGGFGATGVGLHEGFGAVPRLLAIPIVALGPIGRRVVVVASIVGIEHNALGETRLGSVSLLFKQLRRRIYAGSFTKQAKGLT